MDVCPHSDMIDAILERQDAIESENIKEKIAREKFSERFDFHVKTEEEWKKELGDRLKAGDDRMRKIEESVTALNRLVDAFDGFKKTLSIVMWFVTGIVGIMLWIFNEKNADIKATQDTLIKHSITLERLVTSQKDLEKDFRFELGKKN